MSHGRTDQRVECRYNTNVPCLVEAVERPDLETCSGVVLNVSQCGCMVRLDRPLPKGAVVKVRMGKYTISGKVMRVAKRRTWFLKSYYAVGMKAIQPVAPDLFQILAYPTANFNADLLKDDPNEYDGTRLR